MIDIISIQDEIYKKYGLRGTKLSMAGLSRQQIQQLTKLYHSLDFSKEENVRAYLEQKAIFLSGKV